MSDLGVALQSAVLVLIAGVLTAADAALFSFSRARAAELLAEGRAGARMLVRVLGDPAPYLNTLTLLRIAAEVGAIVLVTVAVLGHYPDRTAAVWLAAGLMLVVSFVIIGVGPRTLGRQHATPVALFSAGPLVWCTRVLGPLPRLLILLGNAITPGRGFRAGPFTTETELRELVDYAEKSSLIEADERKMIHSVFELGDTTAREVMVPRGDVVFIERYKNLRQTMSLFLRSGYSRLPVIDDNLDSIVGFVYLKDLVRRDFEAPDVEKTQRVEELIRPAHYVPESKAVDQLLSEMQANRQHIAVVVDEYGGTAGLITIEDVLEEIVGEITDEYDAELVEAEQLSANVARVPSRYPIDDLDDLFGIEVNDEDVDSVGGLMAKHLGRVPLQGSMVEAHGLRFEAERTAGRRHRIESVLVSRIPHSDESADYPDRHG